MYNVKILSYTKIVEQGQVFEVRYEIENTGSSQDTQTIDFTTSTVSGNVDSALDLTLDSGETFESTFTYDTTGEPVEQQNTATVSSDDDSETVTFFSAEKAFFRTISELDDGTTYEFQAAAEDDTGIDTGQTETVDTVKRDLGTVSTNSISSDDIDQRTLDVSGKVDTIGDYAEVGFDVFFEYRQQGDTAWQTTSRQQASSTGTFTETIDQLVEETTYEVRFVGDFGGDNVSGSTVTATTLAPVFELNIDSINDFLQEDRILTVEYSATNTGTVESTQDITLAFDTQSNIVDTDSGVTVSSGGTKTGTLTFDTAGQSEDVYDIFLAAAENQIQSTIEILVDTLIEFLQPANGDLVATRSPELEYRLDIEGAGDAEIFIDGELIDTLSSPFDNVIKTTQLSDLDRDSQARTWRINYTGGGKNRDVQTTFVVGFNLKKVDPEIL